ncbi:MAG: hypothetical protein AMJ46_12685 [Latescibacteria bacterium DG_63]|nr:MAG: hypothetical protein AMJ46_12685 [Latescibacteria bacterium DG_63]
MLLAIDPGHPSHEGDQGCVAPGLVEYRYTWEMAGLLRAHMRHCLPEVETILLRDACDEVVSLAERGQRSADAGVDLVLSLHVDSEATSHARRSSGYYWPGNSVGAEIAEAIIRSMPDPLCRPRGYGVFAARHGNGSDCWLVDARAVIAPHKATSVLIEMGYASNPIDLVALLQNQTQTGIALALMAGVVRAQQLMGV